MKNLIVMYEVIDYSEIEYSGGIVKVRFTTEYVSPRCSKSYEVNC